MQRQTRTDWTSIEPWDLQQNDPLWAELGLTYRRSASGDTTDIALRLRSAGRNDRATLHRLAGRRRQIW